MADIVVFLFVLSISFQVAISSDFNYGMFENFVATEAAFRQEIGFRTKLLKAREELMRLRTEAIEPLAVAANNNSSNVDLQQAVVGLGDVGVYLRRLEKELSAATDKFSNEEGYRAAIRGFLMLRETYRFKVGDLKEGRINALSPRTLHREEFQAGHKMDIHDMVDLAGIAIMEGWMDDAVEFTREGVSMLEESKALEDPKVQKHMKDHLLQLPRMKSFLPQLHNDYVEKRRTVVGHGFKVFPYLIDENLVRKKKQPKHLRDRTEEEWAPPKGEVDKGGDPKEYLFRRVCRGDEVGIEVKKQTPLLKCRLLHHNNPFLKLGPFKMEEILKMPFRMILHDFFSEEEMAWIVEYSKPRLSKARSTTDEKIKVHSKDPRDRRLIHKTVQTWMADKKYDHDLEYVDEPNGHGYVPVDPTGPDDLEEGTVVMPVMRKLATKMEHASTLLLTPRFSSSDFQVTNYGLGGLCETHLDPFGVLEGARVPWERRHLYSTGDFVATFMGWLDDVDAGGETAFDHALYSQAVSPRRGSVAFWIDLKRSGMREGRSSHGGCPVAVGSKWIINKWVYYFNQFQRFPCGLNMFDDYQAFTEVY